MNKKLKDNIKLVASDKEVQKVVLKAIFSTCDIGTDLYEWMEDRKLSKAIKIALFGPYGPGLDPRSIEEEIEWEKENIKSNCLYYGNNQKEVINLLVKYLQQELLK